MTRLAAFATAAFAAAALAGPTTASADPVPPCVKTVVNNAPAYAYSTVYNLQNGEPPRIMGPFLPC